MAAITSHWWRRLVNAYEANAGMVCLQCKNCVIHSLPERFRGGLLTMGRYTYRLPLHLSNRQRNTTKDIVYTRIPTIFCRWSSRGVGGWWRHWCWQCCSCCCCNQFINMRRHREAMKKPRMWSIATPNPLTDRSRNSIVSRRQILTKIWLAFLFSNIWYCGFFLSPTDEAAALDFCAK